jgi:hypothetical protein
MGGVCAVMGPRVPEYRLADRIPAPYSLQSLGRCYVCTCSKCLLFIEDDSTEKSCK